MYSQTRYSNSVPALILTWNRCFPSKNDRWPFPMKRRETAKRTIRQNLTCRPKGKGNKAWKQWERILHDPGILVWPDYTL